MTSNTDETTKILSNLHKGNNNDWEEIYRRVYNELRKIAAAQMSKERVGHTLQPTLLVNEACIRLMNQNNPAWKNRTHFCRYAAGVMRNILREHAERRGAEIRGGNWLKVEINEQQPENISAMEQQLVDFLDWEKAMSKLTEINSRCAEIAEMRLLGGLTLEETAEALEISRTTAETDWVFARAWLRNKLAKKKALNLSINKKEE